MRKDLEFQAVGFESIGVGESDLVVGLFCNPIVKLPEIRAGLRRKDDFAPLQACRFFRLWYLARISENTFFAGTPRRRSDFMAS